MNTYNQLRRRITKRRQIRVQFMVIESGSLARIGTNNDTNSQDNVDDYIAGDDDDNDVEQE